MKIVADENIPFLRGLLEPVADVAYLPGSAIDSAVMADADALITRTRTHCNAALLDGSRCRFIATATIGTDHIDTDYCRTRGIAVANAPGCNAPAVAQYVMAAIGASRKWGDGVPVVGIVGVGNVGSIVDRWARSMGMRTLLCDPPRARREGFDAFSPLSRIAAEADVITFHTPLTPDGPDATYHIADEAFFSSLRRKPLIINAARGGVVDESAALAALDAGLLNDLVIDCWEGEPAISAELLSRSLIGTPHIAGYSRQGKIRATQMALDALTSHFSLPRITVAEQLPGPVPEVVTMEQVRRSYDIMADSRRLKAAVLAEKETATASFERQRNQYDYRDEP